MNNTILVTGGAGFIGSCFVRHMTALDSGLHVVNLDKLTYAGNLDSLVGVPDARMTFVHGDIGNAELVSQLFDRYQPEAIVHLAAESHVDRSIDGPLEFVQTNVMGTAVLLEAARRYFNQLPYEQAQRFRFLHVSTDEVFGSLGAEGAFSEFSPYRPRSPYAASKASADHLVRAYCETYRLPVLITNCGNNYGPFQFPEKLVPLMILNAIEGKPLPVYGDGLQVREWIFVEDHCAALQAVLMHGRVGETYNIGGREERTNLSIVEEICQVVQSQLPQLSHHCADLIAYVEDRPGHDRRYAIDPTKVQRELHWRPQVRLSEGLNRTVKWYLAHSDWVADITSKKYQRQRLGRGVIDHA